MPPPFPRRLPGHPSTSLCSFVQAIFPWQEVTSTGPNQKYVAGRDVWDVQDRCFVREDAFRAPAVRSDAHWRMQESASQARHTDVLEAEWVKCWLECFNSATFPSCKFSYGATLCPGREPVTQRKAAAVRGEIMSEWCSCVAHVRRGEAVCRGGTHNTTVFTERCRREEWNTRAAGNALLRI